MTQKTKKKILLIEDEKEMAEMYRDVFKRAGFEIKLALTAEEGWELLEKEQFDLILLDLLLPKESGLSFLKRLRENEKTEKLPVVVLSNYDAADTRDKAFELGIEAYLMKANFVPKTLVKEIKKHLS